MLCDWTEKVSLLVDGELSRAEAASVETHLAGCAECRAARGEFLFFREQLGAYRAEVSPAAQRRALENILGSKASGATDARAGRRGGLLAALGLSPLRPATAAAFVLVLASAVGLAFYLSRRQQDAPQVAHTPAADSGARTMTTTTPEPTPATPAVVRGRDDNVAGNPPREKDRVVEARAPRPSQRKGIARGVTPSVASTRRPAVEATRPATAGGEVVNSVVAESTARRELPRAGLDTSRHVEQAQLLLRSFRNARAGDDLAYERERSERLLYRNIFLRREAANRNDPLLVSMLGRLEPILLDIANLPARPAPSDVASIRERVRKQNLVVVLQAGVERQ